MARRDAPDVTLPGSSRLAHYRPHVLVCCILVFASLAGMQSLLQNILTDQRFGMFPRKATGEIVLVAIDAPSIAEIGLWPWPRDMHAGMIDTLAKAGASEIAFDVDFSAASNPDSDRKLAEALEAAGGSVILPAFKQWATTRSGRATHVSRPLPEFDAHSWSSVVNVSVEPDGLVRRYAFGDTLDGEYLPSIGALLAGRYETAREPFWLDFSIRPETVPTLSFVDVLRGDPIALAAVKDRKVVVGATAIELGDRFSVPTGRVIAGPELQILAAESMLQNRDMVRTSGIAMLSGIALIMLAMIIAWRRTSATARVLCLLCLAIAAELGATYLQVNGAVLLDTALWQVTIAAYLTVVALDEIEFRGLLGGVAEKRFRRIAMSLGDGLVCTDHRGRITVWNPGAQAMFGFCEQEMIGEPIERVFFSQKDATLSNGDLFVATRRGTHGELVELEGRRKNGEMFPIEACFSRWTGLEGPQYGAVVRDISERKREAERIRYLAEHDSLTGLANRHALYEYLNACLTTARVTEEKVALLIMDLDRFKQINDTHGHACGDALLCEVAERLETLVGETGLVARQGGDEFSIVMIGAQADAAAQTLSQTLRSEFAATPFAVAGRLLRVEASVGLAIYPEHGVRPDDLFGNADLALYRAKAEGRGTSVLFERAIRDEVERRQALEVALGLAVERGELELFYQPQVNLKDGRIVGAEALIRWRSPRRGLVSPAEFMPVVNASSISNRVAEWVLETACRQGRRWEERGLALRIGVNLSPSQFQSGDLVRTVRETLETTGISPSLVDLEVTENVILSDDAGAREIIEAIRALGVNFAFDDFGTGYASLSYLKKFALDGMKIDQSFVRGLSADHDDAAIVGCTISLGKLLGMRVVAEGIEHTDTAELLKNMGCDEGQGYLFAPPLPVDEFERRFLDVDDARADEERLAVA